MGLQKLEYCSKVILTALFIALPSSLKPILQTLKHILTLACTCSLEIKSCTIQTLKHTAYNQTDFSVYQSILFEDTIRELLKAFQI